MGSLNRALIGRTYVDEAVLADAESIQDYARATNDENPRYLDPARPGGIVAPPMYAVRLNRDVLFRAILDPELKVDALRLLHGEQDMRFHDLIRPGDRITTKAEIGAITDKESGQLLELKIDNWRGSELLVESLTTLFIRAPARKDRDSGAGGSGSGEAGGGKPTVGKAGGGSERQPPTGEAPPPWQPLDRVSVAPDQTFRYARASLDVNPVHIDEEVARAAGMKGVILQGLCTMAFCQRAVVSQIAGGDPRGLRRLKVRFSRPVFPGDELTIESYLLQREETSQELALRALNGSGEEVITAGVAEVTCGATER